MRQIYVSGQLPVAYVPLDDLAAVVMGRKRASYAFKKGDTAPIATPPALPGREVVADHAGAIAK